MFEIKTPMKRRKYQTTINDHIHPMNNNDNNNEEREEMRESKKEHSTVEIVEIVDKG